MVSPKLLKQAVLGLISGTIHNFSRIICTQNWTLHRDIQVWVRQLNFYIGNTVIPNSPWASQLGCRLLWCFIICKGNDNKFSCWSGPHLLGGQHREALKTKESPSSGPCGEFEYQFVTLKVQFLLPVLTIWDEFRAFKVCFLLKHI